jgi:Fe-S-cluster containining protein
MCTHCGRCCEDEFLFLTDVEAPIIGQELNRRDSLNTLKKHVKINQYPFNKWGKYVLKFDELCPFQEHNRCSIYKSRPMTCRLYPMKLHGFFDHKNSEIRDVMLFPARGKEDYACDPVSKIVINKLNNLRKIDSYVSKASTRYIAAALLDEKNLGYCFGQPTERGSEFFNPFGETMLFDNEEEVEDIFHIGFMQRHNVVFRDWPSLWRLITDEEATRLVSERTARRATVKTGKRIKRIKDILPHIYDWWKSVQ